MGKINRDSNIELLRVVLMIFIVLWHFLVHGMKLMHQEGYDDIANIDQLPYIIVMGLICYHVNCFVFISGYYGINLKRDRVVSFITQIIFYCFASYLLVVMLFPERNVSFRLIHILFPISTDQYWFFSDYFWLILLSPLLNAGIENISKKKYILILFLLGLVEVSGIRYLAHAGSMRFSLFVFLYLLGRFMNRYQLKINKGIYPLLIWCMSLVSILLVLLFYFYRGTLGAGNVQYILTYVSPLVIIASYSFFFVFKNIKIAYTKTINYLAGGVLGVYLLTENEWTRFYNDCIIDILGTNIFVLLLLAFVIVLSISFFEQIRKKMFVPINNFILALISSFEKRIASDKD